MQMRMYEVEVNDIPKYLTNNPTDQTHYIVIQKKRGNPFDPIAPTYGHFVFYLQ